MKSHLRKLSLFVVFILITMAACNEEEVVTVIPKNELVAVAGPDRSIVVNNEILIDGSGSYNKNAKPFTFSWSVKTKPQGSAVSLAVINTSQTKFTPDVAGIYVIKLVIIQSQWTASDEVEITAMPAEPNGPMMKVLNENISVNTTLIDIFEDPSEVDYLVTSDIQVRADLTIMPGVVIAFEENQGLEMISGTISAKGTSDHAIVFKGKSDQSAYWKGIILHTNSDLNEFEFVTIKQGGSNVFSESGIKANVTLAGTQISGAALKVRHTLFSESGGYGLYIQGMSVLNQFSNNAFYNNDAMAAYIPASQLHKIDVVSFTGTDGLETGGPVLQESEVTWKKLVSGSYVVSSNILIRAGVTIEAGASFKMKTGVTIKVTDNGYLNATGSEAFKIIFTSETNNGYWNGLFFNSFNGNNKLNYCEVSNAGLNRIEDAAYHANIVVSHDGSATVENSIIKNGLGYGLVTKDIDHVNPNVVLVNTFESLQQGIVHPTILNYPDRPSVTGVWLDQWSFNQEAINIVDHFYNKDAGLWFDGAANPWEMSAAGFGIRFNEDGTFTWNIAEHSPMVGCESYSAEYITGTTTISSNMITFNQSYWRSKFINSCDTSWNVDIEVSPSVIMLPYEINKMYNVWTGEELWKLTFTNPDGSTFSFYRR